MMNMLTIPTETTAEMPSDISALEKKLAKENSFFFAFPTFIFTACIFMLFVLTIYQCVDGKWPLWFGLMMNSFLAYASFTPLHEAIHGNISGVRGKAVNLGWSDHLVGWCCTLMLGLPFSSYRLIHLRHHSHTNDPEMDVDYYTHTDNFFKSLLGAFRQMGSRKAMSIVRKIMSANEYNKHQFVMSRNVLLSIYAILILLSFSGYFLHVLLLWIIPTLIAAGFLSAWFQWAPHHPHNERGRYTDTRTVLWPGGTILLLGQNTHIIHHMFPRVPFYRYGRIFRQLRHELEEKGSKISGWGW